MLGLLLLRRRTAGARCQALGAHPEDYRDQRLVDSATYLVRHCDLTVAEIAGALGFTEPELFTKWFRARTREAPTKMRAAAREAAGREAAPEAPTAPDAAADEGEPWFTIRNWRRIMLGLAPREWALALLSFLLEAYPDAFDEPLDD